MCFLPSPPPGTHGILEGPVRSFLHQEHVPTTTKRGHESRGLQAEERKLLGFRGGLMRPAEGGKGLHQAVPHPTPYWTEG